LLPLLRIVERDPDATVVLLPADHYLSDEKIMAGALRRAAALAHADRGSIYLLGVEPDEPDTELGYIVPASRGRDGAAGVLRFIEKPNVIRARVLLDAGALWNVFVMAASVRTLLSLFDDRFSSTIAAMRGFAGAHLDSLYQNLHTVDFSKDVLHRFGHAGKSWTDLGGAARYRYAALFSRARQSRGPIHAHRV